MNIVVLCKNDFAGNMNNLCTAINKHTDHNAIVINSRPAGYKFPQMLSLTKQNLTEIQRKIYNADAVVFKESHLISSEFKIDLKRLNDKPKIFLFGGRGFRREELRTETFKMYKPLPNLRWAVTTTTFLEKYPNWTWIPRCVRFNEIRAKHNYEKLKPPLITTSPSRGSNENSNTLNMFDIVVEELNLKKLTFQSRKIFDINNDECLQLKAPASIFFDRVGVIYGMNSLEAGAFESAVVTEVPEFARNKLEEYGFHCPFVNVTSVKEIINAVTELLMDEEYMKSKGRECLKYVEEAHSGRESAKRLIGLLEEM